MAILFPFSSRTQELLSRMPEQGETHLWLAQVAGGLKGVMSREACFAFLRSVCDEGVRHRPVPDREIDGALDLVFEERSESVNSGKQSLRWPVKDPGLVVGVLANTVPVFDVEKDTGIEAAEALRGLFLPGELVCAGVSSDKDRIRAVEDWGADAAKAQLVCVNPMRGSFGKNKKGEVSVRCQSNVKLRRYLVAEFDDPELSKAMQAVLLSALSRLVPLTLVVDSGGKSLHGWFRVEELGAKDQARFFAACCALGADPTRWDICGWLRMPGGWRPGNCGLGIADRGMKVEGKRQRILFASRGLADTGYGIKDKGMALRHGSGQAALGGGL